MAKQKVFRVTKEHPELSGLVLNYKEIKVIGTVTNWVGIQEGTDIEYEIPAKYAELID